MQEIVQSHEYERIAEAIAYLRARAEQQPQLEEIAAHVGLSPFHFQRLFTRWAGVSPKRFLQHLTVERAKRLLDERQSVLEATFEAGLSSPSRLHDLFVVTEAVTPGEYRRSGEGLRLRYGYGDSPFGTAMVASSERGVVALAFGADDGDVPGPLRQNWRRAELERDDALAGQLIERAFAFAARPGEPLRLLLRGTNFQIRVWRALLEIPFGQVCSYRGVAETVCSADAARAVGGAVGANPIAYLIPCHRVIRADGEIGGYRWDAARKSNMLGWEQARLEAASAATRSAAG